MRVSTPHITSTLGCPKQLVTCGVATLIFWLLYLSFPTTSYSSSSPTLSDDVLNNKINELLQKYSMEKSHVALKIISLNNNRTIYERNTDDLMVIASNVKLFSTATALCKLGPDFKFTTAIYYDGTINNNSLDGNLIVTSNGDPNISGRFYNNDSTAVFKQWAEQLQKIGIKNITGNIILDDSAFDKEYCLPDWPQDQLAYWYCAPVSAISFNDNCVELKVFFNRKTGKIEYAINPPTKYVNVSLDIVLDKNISESQLTFCRIPDTNNITVSGKMSLKDSVDREWITINDPPIFFGTVLKETLERKEIIVAGKILCVNSPYQPVKQLVKVNEIQTDLAQAINIINKKSQNFYAEQLLKTMAHHYKGKGCFKNGLEVIRNFLADEIGIPPDSYSISDGSGLSRKNRFSANQITKLLSYLYHHKSFAMFRDSLNTESWLPKTAKRNNEQEISIWAKTGHINDVSAISGYALRHKNGNNKPPEQPEYDVFSLLVNDLEKLPAGLNTAEQFRDEFVKLLQKYQ
jgi:serine-type D-Ala-D-Ala carboxypeptidase/endopeptidase (penicillin-binding protein 4)